MLEAAIVVDVGFPSLDQGQGTQLLWLGTSILLGGLQLSTLN